MIAEATMHKRMTTTEAAIHLEELLAKYNRQPSEKPSEYERWDFARYVSWFKNRGYERPASYYERAWRSIDRRN